MAAGPTTSFRERTLADASHQRAEQVVDATARVEQAARDLLQKAGLAHITGAPLKLGETGSVSCAATTSRYR